jgi:hypothetical protein
MASPTLVAEITGRDDIPPAVFKQEPQGAKILVLLDRPPETFGGVVELPKSYKELAFIGAGLVVAAGPQAGQDVILRDGFVSRPPYPGGPLCHASQLLYRHVSFQAHCGTALRFSVMDERYEADVVAMCCRDIATIDWDDDPYAEERAEMERFEAAKAKREREEAEADERLQKQRRLQAQYVDRS